MHDVTNTVLAWCILAGFTFIVYECVAIFVLKNENRHVAMRMNDFRAVGVRLRGSGHVDTRFLSMMEAVHSKRRSPLPRTPGFIRRTLPCLPTEDDFERGLSWRGCASGTWNWTPPSRCLPWRSAPAARASRRPWPPRPSPGVEGACAGGLACAGPTNRRGRRGFSTAQRLGSERPLGRRAAAAPRPRWGTVGPSLSGALSERRIWRECARRPRPRARASRTKTCRYERNPRKGFAKRLACGLCLVVRTTRRVPLWNRAGSTDCKIDGKGIWRISCREVQLGDAEQRPLRCMPRVDSDWCLGAVMGGAGVGWELTVRPAGWRRAGGAGHASPPRASGGVC